MAAQGMSTATLSPTATQRRTWVLERLAPGNRALVVAAAVLLDAAATSEALRRALEAAALRHDVLSWRFVEGAGGGVEIRVGTAAVPLELVETRDPLELAVGAWCRRPAPFDLERGPLVRAALVVSGGRAALALAG